MGITEVKPEFVEFMPEEIEPGIVYISEKYGATKHLCACGCGRKVNMSIQPFWENGWIMTVEENEITFSPSIGNFQFPCRSHYWIEKNKIKWA